MSHPEHATLPLAELERRLAQWNPPTLTSAAIAEALEKGRRFAAETLERCRKEALHAWDDLDQLVLR